MGYGATGFHLGGEPPPRPVYADDRYRGMVRLLTTNSAVGDQLLKTSGIGIVGGGEGSCFGDSGGPLFMPDQETIVGVTSFGRAPLCRGPAYNQRMDMPRVLRWVRSFPNPLRDVRAARDVRIGPNFPQGGVLAVLVLSPTPYCYALPTSATLLCPLALYGGGSNFVELREAEVRRIHPLRTRVNKPSDDVTEAEYSPTC